MNKLCTRCGNQLNIAERQCASCGAFNPFYIASYKPRQLATAETGHLETQLLVVEETEQREVEKLAHAQLEQEQREREKTETILKQELFRVKNEAEQYQQHTVQVVSEVREELLHLDEENKRLKHEVELLSKNKNTSEISQNGMLGAGVGIKSTGRRGSGLLILLLTACLGIGFCISFIYISGSPALSHRGAAATKTAAANAGGITPDETNGAANSALNTNMSPGASSANAGSSTSAANNGASASNAANNKPLVSHAITPDKVKHDMIGKKISGCGITIKNPGEIVSVSNLVLVLKDVSGDTKYKFSASIKQGADKYSATPYIYYDARGVLIRIDGTNCE